MRVALLGKKYLDKIYHIKDLKEGETNISSFYIERLGGAHNFINKEKENLIFHPILRGEKIATIINDKQNSTRTSFVHETKKSIITTDDAAEINSNFDWLHICYADDLGSLQNLIDVNIPISLDFCTLQSRSQYMDIITKAKFILDSRERVDLYNKLKFKNPLILHDPYGVEVRVSGALKYTDSMTPTKGLSVNGAGDLFAKSFIKNFAKHDIFKLSTVAMIETTDQLLEREH